MHTFSGPLWNMAQRLARQGALLLPVLALALALTILVVTIIAADAAGAETSPVMVAPFRW